jgi:glutamate-1-semialdehyde 2,1-aminomutase
VTRIAPRRKSIEVIADPGPLGPERTRRSREWFARARSVLAGGISSSARSNSAGRLDHPLYMDRGVGSQIWDLDGNQFTDYLLAYGSCILGHVPATVLEAVGAQLGTGSMYGTCNTTEVELAEQICAMVPCAELVRYANSGSEAISGAVRAARGHTARTKVLKFEGHYHGWVDVLAVSNRPSAEECGPLEAPANRPHSRGIPAGVYEDVVICPWNEPEILKSVLDAHGSEIAAVIAEPIVANNACTMPGEGYLELVRRECTRRGIVLIFDEIVTGFRIARGGAQEAFGVLPDLAVYSKAIGGGFPIAAFCGRRSIMDAIAANTVKHGGTYNGNPVCAAAALATLRRLAMPGVIETIAERGEAVAAEINRAARDFGVPCSVQGMGGMFQVVFTPEGRPTRHYRDLMKADVKRFAAFWQALLDHGIHANSSGSACWFVSAAHSVNDVERTGEAVRAAMRSIA